MRFLRRHFDAVMVWTGPLCNSLKDNEDVCAQSTQAVLLPQVYGASFSLTSANQQCLMVIQSQQKSSTWRVKCVTDTEEVRQEKALVIFTSITGDGCGWICCSNRSSLTAVVFHLQDRGVEVFGCASVWRGGQHSGVVPLPLLHGAGLVTQDIHQWSDTSGERRTERTWRQVNPLSWSIVQFIH